MIVSGDRIVHHSVRESFGQLLRSALAGEEALAAHGPIYAEDPAAYLMAPFVRSAREASVDPLGLSPYRLAPGWILERAAGIRQECVTRWAESGGSWTDAGDWTRAGLVLEIASRFGVPLVGGARAHVRWKMRGTVTGRFGVEPGGFNPLTIPRDQRDRVRPSGPDRSIVVIDFRAMDLCSMVSLFPSLADRYVGATDLHSRTAGLVGVERDVAKKELFVFAYGGSSPHHDEFERQLPEVAAERGPELARRVQARSALAFRSGLSEALPLLTGPYVWPLFSVHDELVMDVLSDDVGAAGSVAEALEAGASRRVGVTYTTEMKVGRDYAEAKS